MRAKNKFTLARRVRDGFTLIELLVVIGLMAFLATISTAGYFAASRGMAARGALQDTASLIRYAMQTCLIDQVPTAVLFMNYRTDKASNGGDAYGKAIAIRMTGRISYVASGGTTADSGTISTGMLVDEFADWNESYTRDSSTGAKALSVRLYRMQDESQMKQGYENCSSLMYNWVGCAALDRFNSEYMIGAGQKVEDWCASKNVADNSSYAGYRNGNAYRWGLPFHQKNDGLSISGWHIGDAYGTEIRSLTLPRNYIFGSTAPQSTELKAASPAALVFWPDKLQSSTEYQFSTQEITISLLNDVEGKDIAKVGKIDSDALKDQD